MTRGERHRGGIVPGDVVLHQVKVDGRAHVDRQRVIAGFGDCVITIDGRGVRRKVPASLIERSPAWAHQPVIPGVLDSPS